MKKINKICVITLILFLVLITICSKPTMATSSMFSKVEYSEEFLKWMKLSDEEKNNTLIPAMYNVVNNNIDMTKNPLYRVRMVGSNSIHKFSLKDIIPTNLLIRNQMDTEECWAFASLSSLETNLALSNYKNGGDTTKVYDFSERHMDYATSKIFSNNIENKYGYNRKAGSGNIYLADSYLTNGTGAIDENEMPFENNENIIDISEIKNKTITTQVYDTIYFANYKNESDSKKIEIMNQIKQHIQNYGAVYAQIHGASPFGGDCYNNDTGAVYCKNHNADHAVSIIGWDDTYNIENFAQGYTPASSGAWIIRNSWGERIETELSVIKEEIFNAYMQQCISNGWTESSLIPNEIIENAGYTIENDIAYIPIGNNGIMYVSYEDCNVSSSLFGIIKATDNVNYDNIYQYNYYYPGQAVEFNSSNIMLCNIFDRQTAATEYLTQISLYAPETYICKVYVNPNGTNVLNSSMQLVELKSGESETINVGYHTLEFLKPIAINSKSFAVVVEIQSMNQGYTNILLESKINGLELFDSVKVEEGKCLIASGNDFDNCEWLDFGKLEELNIGLSNGDSTIKAFTTNELIDESLKSIQIITPPNKTEYFEGENFDKTGMEVKANYRSKTKPSVILDNSSYSIANGANLKAGQKSVIITFEDKSIEQSIYVERNSVIELKIKELPINIEYKEGQTFDRTGMIIEATYKDGSIKTISDYIIVDGNNLRTEQTYVTIKYDEKTINQPITVIPNPLIEIKISKEPNKVKYIAGQNFDKTGMIIIGVYQDETTEEIFDYVIENGNDLKKDQVHVTIKYKEKSTILPIIVEEKSITEIHIDKMPTKLTYIQNEEGLDLTGGILKITYNDNTTELILMNYDGVSVTGYDNTELGKRVIRLTYQSYIAQFEVEIIEEEKPENSKLDDALCNIEKIKAYYFTDNSKNDYVLMEIEINNIIRNLSNDKVEYYYYLSSNMNEHNITGWAKITENQDTTNKLRFIINSRDIENYNEIANEMLVYLYIKEVAIKDGNQNVLITKGIKFETDIEIEKYIDNVKEQDGDIDINNPNNNGKDENFVDDTLVSGKLPQTGIKRFMLLIICIITIIGISGYTKYRCLSKYIK